MLNRIVRIEWVVCRCVFVSWQCIVRVQRKLKECYLTQSRFRCSLFECDNNCMPKSLAKAWNGTAVESRLRHVPEIHSDFLRNSFNLPQSPVYLYKHVRLINSKKKRVPTVCPKCYRTLRKPASLQAHIRLVHEPRIHCAGAELQCGGHLLNDSTDLKLEKSGEKTDG